MSFYYEGGGVYAPHPYQYYQPSQQRSLRWWHIALLLISIVMATVGVFARMVLSNLQPLHAETASTVHAAASPLPSAPATLALNVSPEDQQTPESQQLEASIQAWTAAHTNATWAVDVRQIDGGLAASYRAEQKYRIASLYKLFLLQPLASKVPSSGWNAQMSQRSYKDCVDAMLRVSDNPCAEAIGSRLGWSYVDKQLRSLGYGNTHLAVGEATGTAQDTTKLLQNLYNKNGFDQLARDLGMKALAVPKKAEGIRQGCAGCTVYNKTGEADGYRHDAAIIEKDGRVYSIVILSNGGSWSQITDLTRAIHHHL